MCSADAGGSEPRLLPRPGTVTESPPRGRERCPRHFISKWKRVSWLLVLMNPVGYEDSGLGHVPSRAVLPGLRLQQAGSLNPVALALAWHSVFGLCVLSLNWRLLDWACPSPGTTPALSGHWPACRAPGIFQFACCSCWSLSFPSRADCGGHGLGTSHPSGVQLCHHDPEEK